ncbi:shikimate dehydrogenase substrate binding domain-containing protein [Colletotrichum tofieldiae]|uniref:Shikimate dehydrogenase substrate binding domain-containing protein n=1 Tax=Colletotrichum tofieldiae TaxID=708197 RepID=A0A166Z852_9PEZI|nr:shikimate dehydrogenase substrate binding domain-containing protein [Colletotrichum tofieldiae]GKT94711.1 shikimate dehydrogenase substrate binding domain-containing protein [Colletotrichum tofieldiae]
MESTEQPKKTIEKCFFIFGHNISHTLSPTLHNAGFQELGLPYHYSIHQTESVDETVEEIIRRDNFGGASVTFPHKLQIGMLLDSVTSCAEKIGAVNTVIVDKSSGKQRLLGDNTDWHGIKRCIEKSGVKGIQSSAALILGAGGAARAAFYACLDLGISEVLIVNRTLSKAQAMADQFPSVESHVIATLGDAAADRHQHKNAQKTPIRVVIACVPADDLGKDNIPSELFAGTETGVLIEMAYRPQVTGMMAMASCYRGWKVFKGIDVLEEQGYAQFESWTGKKAPVLAMRTALQAKIKRNSQAKSSV